MEKRISTKLLKESRKNETRIRIKSNGKEDKRVIVEEEENVKQKGRGRKKIEQSYGEWAIRRDASLR